MGNNINLVCFTSALLLALQLWGNRVEAHAVLDRSGELCPKDWSVRDGVCYYSPLEKSLPFEEAEATCVSMGAHLVSIRSREEQAAVSLYMTSEGLNSIHIGINDIAREGTWVWTDGESSSFTNWLQNQPNNYRGNQDCGVLTLYGGRGLWDDDRCFLNRNFICQIRPASHPTTSTSTTTEAELCPVGWKKGTGVCYYSPVEKSLSFDAAEATCVSMGAHLVSIKSGAEQAAVSEYMTAEGLKSIHIGINDIAKEGVWVWTDGESSSFTNWLQNQPDNYRGNQDCGVLTLYGGRGFWDDDRCFLNRNFICQTGQKIQPATTTTSTTTTTATTTATTTKLDSCPWGWKTRNGVCYYSPVEKFLPFDQAEAVCASMGAHLVSIRSRVEQAAVREYMTAKRLRSVFIGYTDRAREGKWVWTDGNTSSFTLWARWQPDNYNGIQDCVRLTIPNWNGFWDDASCDQRLNFICQIRLDN